MKKNNKKKLPKYDIGKFGYLPNRLLNTNKVTVERGIVNPKTKASTMEATMLPNAIKGGLESISAPLQAVYAMTPTITKTGLNMINVGNALMTANDPNLIMYGNTLKNAGENSTKLTATAASNVLNGVGIAKGLYDIGSDFAHESDLPSTSEMRNSIGTETYNTEDGTYKQRQGLDTASWDEYERQNAISKKIGLTTDSAGLFGSIGGLLGSTGALGSVGGPGGTLAGLLVGTVLGGIASAAGFGDNEEEMKHKEELIVDEGSRWNRQEFSKYLNQVNKNQFANRQGAANGKLPGYRLGKGVARLSGGEVVELGPLRVEVPGPKNNKDEYIAREGTLLGEMVKNKNSTVYTNKGGISDYIKNGGDGSVARGAMKYILTNYKNGKMPRHALGKAGEYLNVLGPHLMGYLDQIELERRVKNADRTAPKTEVSDFGASNVINEMYKDQIDPREYINKTHDLYRLGAWDMIRTPGLGFGGRVAGLANLYGQGQRLLHDTMLKIAEANFGQRNAARKFAIEDALNKRGYEMDNFWKTANMQLLINSAYESFLQQIPLNKYNIWGSLAHNISQIGNTADARASLDRMLKIYERGAENDDAKTIAYINSLNNNAKRNDYSTWTPARWITNPEWFGLYKNMSVPDYSKLLEDGWKFNAKQSIS